MTTKKRGIITGLVIVSVVAFFLSFVDAGQSKQVNDERQIPLILIPGTNSDKDRFDDLIQRMRKKIGPRDILKIEVQKNGALKWTSSLRKKSVNPFIVISFDDNSEEAVDEQAKWIQIALDKAHDLYQFDAYDALGHSNGGLAWTIYLEEETSSQTSQMKKLITLGTPYNDLETADNPYPNRAALKETDRLADMVKEKQAIPNSLSMVSIAGDEQGGSDGVVPVTSALASEKIYKNDITSYQEKVFYGDNVQHSDLIENEKIIDYIVNELY
ncbi:MAG: Alpha/beta hydrolase superfamily protein [Lactococcus sp.]|jgi:uncharacterized alpha/beta hydrolase family protein